MPEVNVLSKGLENLLKLSKKREMPSLYKHLLEMRKRSGRVSVHHECRRKFTDTRKKTERKRLLVATVTSL